MQAGAILALRFSGEQDGPENFLTDAEASIMLMSSNASESTQNPIRRSCPRSVGFRQYYAPQGDSRAITDCCLTQRAAAGKRPF